MKQHKPAGDDFDQVPHVKLQKKPDWEVELLRQQVEEYKELVRQKHEQQQELSEQYHGSEKKANQLFVEQQQLKRENNELKGHIEVLKTSMKEMESKVVVRVQGDDSEVHKQLRALLEEQAEELHRLKLEKASHEHHIKQLKGELEEEKQKPRTNLNVVQKQQEHVAYNEHDRKELERLKKDLAEHQNQLDIHKWDKQRLEKQLKDAQQQADDKHSELLQHKQAHNSALQAHQNELYGHKLHIEELSTQKEELEKEVMRLS